ncbi:hypothetical protein MRO13_18100 (plasmid) [Vibrio metschnikovii]|uniref:hypothetical protein n=1 Tax=Vibrio metschnikovii TaxID=28172 RepID=UPI00331F0ED3
MPKYQFFCKPNLDRSEFTYLNMESETYLYEKKELLSLGLEVNVMWYKLLLQKRRLINSNQIFCEPLLDYANSSVSGGLATFIFESFKSVREKHRTSCSRGIRNA